MNESWKTAGIFFSSRRGLSSSRRELLSSRRGLSSSRRGLLSSHRKLKKYLYFLHLFPVG